MENADIFKKNPIFKDFLALNVHENANRKPSSNSKQEAGKPHKQRTFRLLMWGVIPF